MNKAAILAACALLSQLPGCASKQMMLEAMSPQMRAQRLSMEDAEIFSRYNASSIRDVGESKTVEIAKESVRRLLKDPDSAQIKDVTMHQYKNGIAICGMVNAKNSYGGYVGFRGFMAGPFGARIFQEEDGGTYSMEYAENAGIKDSCMLYR